MAADDRLAERELDPSQPGAAEPAFATQVRRAFERLNAVLGAGNCSFVDVVDVKTFHADPEAQFDTIMAVRDTMIRAPPYPNWTAVGVTWLAGFDFEIKAIAGIPAGDRASGG